MLVSTCQPGLDSAAIGRSQADTRQQPAEVRTVGTAGSVNRTPIIGKSCATFQRIFSEPAVCAGSVDCAQGGQVWAVCRF